MTHPLIPILLISLALFGCTDLEYLKVPTPTQYDAWTDEMQREADKMDGVRYYLPRPFLALKKSTPVAQRVAFVSFARSGTDYLAVLPQDAPTWVKRAVPTKLSAMQALAATLSGPDQSKPNDAQQQSARPTDEQTPSDDQPQPPRPPSELRARTGYISDTDPVTHIDDRMDVVYLPDMEEQYVIRATAGLGRIDVETRLRNGWAAEVFSKQVDNSNLIPYVIEQLEKTSEAAAGIFTTWAPVAAGLPPGAIGAALQQQSAKVLADPQKASQVLGNLLIFKIAEVRIAQPGLYPILKPREIRQWIRDTGVVQGRDPQQTFELFLRQAKTPWIRPDMAFIPAPPFTMIGFNTTTDLYFAPAMSRSEVARVKAAVEVKKAGKKGDGKKTQGQMNATNAKEISKALEAWKSGAGATALSKATDRWTPVVKGDHYVFELSFPNATDAKAAHDASKEILETKPEGVQDPITVFIRNQEVLAIRVPNGSLRALVGKLGAWLQS